MCVSVLQQAEPPRLRRSVWKEEKGPTSSGDGDTGVEEHSRLLQYKAEDGVRNTEHEARKVSAPDRAGTDEGPQSPQLAVLARFPGHGTGIPNRARCNPRVEETELRDGWSHELALERRARPRKLPEAAAPIRQSA